MVVYLAGNGKFKLLFKVFRGFNINKDIMIENLSQESLIGKRFMYDLIKSSEGKLLDFPISKEMILSCKMAYQKYHQAQQEKKSSSEVFEKSRKRQLKQEEIMSAKRKKIALIKQWRS